MTTFASAFREHVTSDLRKEIRAQGARLALETTSFEEAYETVFDIAQQRGAYHLSDPVFDALRDWIATEILRTLHEFLPDVVAYREMSDRVVADIARCEALWPAAA